MTEIGHSERLCLEHERDKPGTVRGHIGDNRECEARARRQEEGVLENEKYPFGGDLWKKNLPREQGGLLSPESLQRHLLEPQRKSPLGAAAWWWAWLPGGRRAGEKAGAVPHKQQLRTCPLSEGWLSSESLPRGLTVTGLSSHQGRSCWRVAVTLPLATTLHRIPGEGRS